MDAIQNSTILMWGVTLLIFLIRMGARLAGKSCFKDAVELQGCRAAGM
jgi:hypothetical protein